MEAQKKNAHLLLKEDNQMTDDTKKSEILNVFLAQVITCKGSSQLPNACLQNSMACEGEELSSNGAKQMPCH